jgi:hypothetical protein
MFINMKSYPKDKTSADYKAFWQYELDKVTDGVTINGVYISGWLYWHLNHWKIITDTIDSKGREQQLLLTPGLRDNEWIFAEAEHTAQTSAERKALCILGLRQFAKTTIESSYAARSATINKNSQNIIVGGAKSDLANVTAMLDLGMLNVTPYFRVPRITRDWKSDEVLLGVKTKKGDNIVHSRFRIRNTQAGRNTEIVAGTTIKCLIFDEIGKQDFLGVYAAAKPALLGPKGWRCIPILTGTGGAFEKSKDAEIMFFNPESNDVLAFLDETTNRKTGIFLPGTLRNDCKEDSTLAAFLGKEPGTELDMPMRVSNVEKAMAKIMEERRNAATNPDPRALLKEKMYHPIKPEEVFLSESNTVFPQHLIEDQQEHLAKLNYKPLAHVDLYRDAENIVKHKHTNKKPIMNYPITESDNAEGVFVIYEFPISSAPFGLYIGGTDPYKQSQAHYSDSVGATYIYKRIHNITGEGFQDVVVASYVGRPATIQEWYEKTKLLLEFYNAKSLVENMDYGFIQHCIEKNEAHKYLATIPRFLSEVHINSSGNSRIYGIHMTKQIKEYLVNCGIEYMTEEIAVERDENGNATKTVLGVRRILDPLLLQELRRFDYEVNTDRAIAFLLAVAYSRDLNKTIGKIKETNSVYEAYGNFKKSTPFNITIRNPFRRPK